MNIIRVATALIICSSPALALINRYARVATYAKLGSNNPFRSSLPVYSSPEDEENNEPTKKESSSLPGVSETSMKSQESDGTTYPIDLPSPILLSTSMVLAIVGTGTAIYFIFLVFCYLCSHRYFGGFIIRDYRICF